MRPTIVIAGATGFIGRWFIERYHTQYRIIALSRGKMEPDPSYDKAEWRQVEMYSLSSTEAALRGAELAIYLVHSMHPSTRLHQGAFEDTDLLLADNFARAAKVNGLRQIIFMGGILPDKEDKHELSRHLRSRWEVEVTLASTGVPVTALRAGIIVGKGGSSFRMIKKLVERLPVMICPAWCTSETQPVALEDALKMIDFCLDRPSTFNQAYDIGGPGQTTYMDMLKTVAALMNKRRIIRPVWLFSPGLSKMWVSFFTDSSPALVSPLVESLRHKLVATDNELLKQFPDRIPFEKAAHRALFGKEPFPEIPRRSPGKQREKNTVRSVQRLPNPAGHTATYVARIYQRWLPILFRLLIRVETQEDFSTFYLAGLPLLKLQFIPSRSDDDRQLFYIMGGRLVKRKDYGWLEFRRVLGGEYVISAIHEFVPALPWYLYVLTQANAHRWVMYRFGKYLREGKLE
jgi:uncharacterized protein YbjT (DUF2867 family)